MRFRSKIDAWLALVIVAALSVALVASWNSSSGQGGPATLLIVGPLLLGAVLPIWMFIATYYEVVAGQLKVVSGPFRWQIPVAEIERIQDSKSLRSGPALSLYRLEITYSGGRKLLISPFDRVGFLEALSWDDSP